jgi:CheY-like chemotaxis protein
MDSADSPRAIVVIEDDQIGSRLLDHTLTGRTCSVRVVAGRSAAR